MLDILISGGTVVTPHGAGAYDIGVKDGKIAIVSAAGGIDAEAKRVIDANGKLVVPGGIDPHVHCHWPVMHEIDGEEVLSGPPAQVSKAALHGGTTMMVDFAVNRPGETIEQSIERTDGIWKGNSHCDFAYHVMLLGSQSTETIAQIPEMVQAGHPSLKIFTTDVTPSRSGRKMDHGSIWETLNALAASGGIAMIHAEDDEIVMHNYERYIAAGKTSYTYISGVHNSLSEELSFQRVIRMAEHVEGAALYMAHVSAASGVDAIAQSRAKGFPVYGEALHQYLMFTDEDYKKPNGQMYHTYPSQKSEEERLVLWRGVREGSLGTVGTDAICVPLDIKTLGERIDDMTGGNVGVEPRMGVMYSEAVVRQGLSLERFVDFTSANAARYLGMYPQKGAIAAGSDADIAILETGLDYELSNDSLHETDYSPWEGAQIHGWPVMTLLHGKVVVEDGQFHGDTSEGRRIDRKVVADVRERAL